MVTWKSKPIFVSSTFADMQAERDHLRSVVFPALEERLRARRSYVEWVDLRLGVATASLAEGEARELQVLKVCLAEVRRCRPFLIVLLGDRYGWIPPPERMLSAAREEGMDESVVGRSVTDLEIQFGIFNDPEQQPRSFVYLREPLDYGAMPPETAALYSDERSADAGGAERAERLASLKADISARIPERVRSYRAAWDSQSRRVTGLDAWGRQVVEDIIVELDKDSGGEAQAELTWQQVERLALDDFTADRARDFVGREAVLARLEAFARSPKAEGAPWALSLTGEAGAGKSAIFSVLRTRLQTDDVVVLAHAAGASPQAPSVDRMLLRWIEELASTLGVDPSLPQKPTPDDIDSAFASLLGRVGLLRRVVVLIDALDQLEPTVRGRQMTWLPKLWSDNARLIMTAIPGEATNALSKRKVSETEALGPITRDEARQVIDRICGRYHRTFEPEVIEALLAKSGPDGPAWGNTLWLVLAVEDLNLVDADDFEKALKSYPGSPAEQLRALMVDRVSALPFDIAGVYLSAFAHAEDLFDAIEVRSFLGVIAVSRSGWRETDFQALMPKLAGLPWDELRFATLRRLFRGQVKQRGVLGQWTFTHTQMAVAVSRYLEEQEVSPEEIHTEIADHMLSLPPEDPLRQTETMVHLLGSGDLEAAAEYYGTDDLSEAEVSGATAVLAEGILHDGTQDNGHGIETVRSLLVEASSPEKRGVLAQRVISDIDETIALRVRLPLRLSLAEMAKHVLERLAATDPSSSGWQRAMSVATNKIGDVLQAQGNFEKALETFRLVLEIRERLASTDPSNRDRQQDLAVALNNVGTMLRAQGNSCKALASYRASLAILERLVAADPSNIEWQRSLSVSQSNIADLLKARGTLEEALVIFRSALEIKERLASSNPSNSDRQRDLSVALKDIASVFQVQGNLEEALTYYRSSMRIDQHYAAADPTDNQWQLSLAMSLSNVGNMLEAQGNLAEALANYRAAVDIQKYLIKVDPTNRGWQHDFSTTLGNIGNVLQVQGNLGEALASYQAAMEIRELLATAEPSDTLLQHNLSASRDKIGSVLQVQGNIAGALAIYRASLETAHRLVESDPMDTQWQRYMAVSLNNIGDAHRAQHHLIEALASYRASNEIFRGLVKVDPTHKGSQQDLAVSLNQIGTILQSQGNPAEALVSFRASMEIQERLASADPSNSDWQQSLSVSLNNIGDVLRAQGNLEQALAYYLKSLEIDERLAASELSNVGWQRDLSLSLFMVGNVLKAQGNLEKALSYYRSSLEIDERLVASEPLNIGWQRNLSVSRDKIGDVLQAQGNIGEASVNYRISMEIRKRLADSDPSNSKWQYDLSVSNFKLAKNFEALGQVDAAIVDLQQASAILATVADQSDGDGWRKMLKHANDEISRLKDANQ